MSVTLDVFQVEMFPLKALDELQLAPNVPFIVVTLDVFHPERS
jgi:hypothetical protein